MCMQNRDHNFETLIGHAKSMLGRSCEGLKRKYLHYPVSLKVNPENRALEKVIEIRFNEQEATIALDSEQTDKYDAIYLFFDNQTEENIFIEYLTVSYGFDFRKNCWLLDECRLKVMSIKDIFCFCFFRQ